ncbi:MAG: hypothetical protein JSV35_04020 [Candidatus Bathyarchaeota archaeon]|nr:MAG: hypothetical protein JSV35_04020 [Candidatus Bathyarchaeota archaeon]
MGGLIMGIRGFNLNAARAFVGRNVNLHLKDGSVLVNIYVADAKREVASGKPAIFYRSRSRKSSLKLLLREVDWMEKVSPLL